MENYSKFVKNKFTNYHYKIYYSKYLTCTPDLYTCKNLRQNGVRT